MAVEIPLNYPDGIKKKIKKKGTTSSIRQHFGFTTVFIGFAQDGDESS